MVKLEKYKWARIYERMSHNGVINNGKGMIENQKEELCLCERSKYKILFGRC